MRKFKVRIKETLSKVIEVTAEDAEKAEDLASELYYSDQIELDYNNLVSTTFKVLNP